MPKRGANLLIEDMLTAIRKIEKFAADLSRESFLQDDKTIDAVVRNLEVLGEAARQIPDELVIQHSDVPWHLMRGLRNRVVHDYFGLDLEIIWQIISEDLAQLKSQLENVRRPAIPRKLSGAKRLSPINDDLQIIRLELSGLTTCPIYRLYVH